MVATHTALGRCPTSAHWASRKTQRKSTLLELCYVLQGYHKLPQEGLVDRVICLLYVAVAQIRQEGSKLFVFACRHLHTHEHLAEI